MRIYWTVRRLAVVRTVGQIVALVIQCVTLIIVWFSRFK